MEWTTLSSVIIIPVNIPDGTPWWHIIFGYMAGMGIAIAFWMCVALCVDAYNGWQWRQQNPDLFPASTPKTAQETAKMAADAMARECSERTAWMRRNFPRSRHRPN